MEILLVMTNCPDAKSAHQLASALIERRLAACVNVLAPCTSVYRWKEKIEETEEVPMQIKTTVDRYAAVEDLIRKQHPYELPEIIAVPLSRGLPAYLDWVTQECKASA